MDNREWCRGAGTQVLDYEHIGLTVAVCPTCEREAPVSLQGNIRPHPARAQLRVA